MAAKRTRGTNNVDEHVANRIRLRRKAVGMSQSALGDALGVTFQQIQKYEKATNRVGTGRLAEIANALGVSVGFFYEGAPRPNPFPSGNGSSAEHRSRAHKFDQLVGSTEGTAVINAMSEMVPKDRKRLVKIARALAVE